MLYQLGANRTIFPTTDKSDIHYGDVKAYHISYAKQCLDPQNGLLEGL